MPTTPIKMPTIVSQIEDLENNIKASEDEMDMIDRSLRLRRLSENERLDLEHKMKQLQEQIKENERDLGRLRKENRKSMLMSVAILALFIVAYLIITS